MDKENREQQDARADALCDDDNFKFSEQSLIEITKRKLTETDGDLLGDVLRRQSLFKLKEKMNGRVGKQISDIERRKLSAYRFANSPLKRASNISKKSPLAVHKTKSKLSKSLLATPIMQEQYVIKSTSASKSSLMKSPLTVQIKNNEFSQIKKLQRIKSVKRLSVNGKKTQSPSSNRSVHGSPISKAFIQTNQLSYVSESFDL
jgi:hypothetical protein